MGKQFPLCPNLHFHQSQITTLFNIYNTSRHRNELILMQVLQVSNKFKTHPEAVLKVPLSLWWFPFSVNVYGSFLENAMCVAEPFKIISVLSLILSLVIPTNNVCFVLFKISIVFGMNVTDCIKEWRVTACFLSKRYCCDMQLLIYWLKPL